MTSQASDLLDNRHAAVDFGELALYRVVIGDIHANQGWGDPYPFQNQPAVPKDSTVCSALWRGHVAEFTLASDGSLTLDAYRYPLAPNKPREAVNEHLSGDFWLVMKSSFAGNRVYVPFVAGIIVADEKNWVIEGSEPLESRKHPKRPRRFEPKNVPIGEPVFIGTVSRVRIDEVLEGHPWVVFDREIPRLHYWCEVQIRRDNAPIAETKICGSSGGGAGPWMLRPPIEPMVQVGDRVFAVARLPTDDEIKRQTANEAT
jgi:hypothetical protein